MTLPINGWEAVKWDMRLGIWMLLSNQLEASNMVQEDGWDPKSKRESYAFDIHEDFGGHYDTHKYYQRGYLTQEDDSGKNIIRFYKIHKSCNQSTVEKLKITWDLQTLSITSSVEWRFETKIVCQAGKHRTPLSTLSEFAFNSFVLSPYAYENRWLSVWTISSSRAEKN